LPRRGAPTGGPAGTAPPVTDVPGQGPTPEAAGSPDGTGGTPRRPHRKRRISRGVRRVVGVLIAVVLIYFVLAKLSTQKGHISLLAHLNLGFVIAGLGLEAGSLVAYAALTRAILSQFGKPPRLGRLVQIDMSTLALTRVLPGGSAAGTGLGFRLLTAAGVDKADAGLTLAVQSVGSAVILNSLLWVGLVMSIPFRALVHTPGSENAVPKIFYVGAALIGVILVGFFGFVVLSLTRGEERSLRLVRKVSSRVRFLHEETIVGTVERIADQLRLMKTNRSLLAQAIAWGSANWLLDAGALWVSLAAFHYYLAPDALLISYSLANIVAVIPLTPGGVGLVEVVLTTVLVAFGASHQVAGLGVIAYRLMSFWLPIPLGGLAYLTIKFSHRSGTPQPAETRPATKP
ncbi:MAG TPA: lysylphosphatidylglycerol synthase transmembrane domain-containing protein, partial [Actinomycetota bacterium]|nr:lysylphosphatidylglycerol synthase transmembrane domain-containing protein [Actinomycetota bacterium]